MEFERRTFVYPIDGGSYDSVGSATGKLKADLRRLGLGPGTMRRVVIAAYEAEANAVIHARGGYMTAALGRSHLCVEVRDEGPGIGDIRMAMRDGYSTAPEEARQLGFGAGMGFPNIKRSSDRLLIETGAGRGTRVIFEVELVPASADAAGRNSMDVRAEHCRECLACLRACPTEALRVRRRRPALLDHLCIDCTAYLAACSSGALRMETGVHPGRPEADKLVVPPAFLAQFWPRLTSRQALAGLAGLGYREVLVAEPWERALIAAVLDRAGKGGENAPIIAPVCPAAVNLVRTRFHALVSSLAPLLSPLEAVLHDLGANGIALVAICPAQRSALLEAGLPAEMIADPVALREDMLRSVESPKPRTPAATRSAAGARGREEPAVLRVSGIRHLLRTFEMAENGLLEAGSVLEPYACEGGCFGSPLLAGQAHLNREAWRRLPAGGELKAAAIARTDPFRPRRGQRLDADMSRAVARLGEIEDLLASLPGRDCGRCGAPSCQAFAEDVVTGRAARAECPFAGVNGRISE